MVTNYYPHPVAPQEAVATDANLPDVHQMADGFGTGVMERVNRMFCGLRGHDSLLHFERDRMFLKCASCGHESPGWELTETPPTVRLRGDARRHALARPHLVDVRRIA